MDKKQAVEILLEIRRQFEAQHGQAVQNRDEDKAEFFRIRMVALTFAVKTLLEVKTLSLYWRIYEDRCGWTRRFSLDSALDFWLRMSLVSSQLHQNQPVIEEVDAK